MIALSRVIYSLPGMLCVFTAALLLFRRTLRHC